VNKSRSGSETNEHLDETEGSEILKAWENYIDAIASGQQQHSQVKSDGPKRS